MTIRALCNEFKDRITFTCPNGHFLTAVALNADYGGSADEVELGRYDRMEANRFDRAAARCYARCGGSPHWHHPVQISFQFVE